MTGRSNSAATSRRMKIDSDFEPSQMGRNVAFHTITLLYDRFHVVRYVVIMMLLALWQCFLWVTITRKAVVLAPF